MSMTDPIGDLLARLRNGAHARKESVDCPWSVIKERIARVLVAEGFLRDCSGVELGKGKKALREWLSYDVGQGPVINGLKRVSKPSARIYVGADAMPKVRGGMGVSIVSTPLGILVDREAVRRKVGGELLCSVW